MCGLGVEDIVVKGCRKERLDRLSCVIVLGGFWRESSFCRFFFFEVGGYIG